MLAQSAAVTVYAVCTHDGLGGGWPQVASRVPPATSPERDVCIPGGHLCLACAEAHARRHAAQPAGDTQPQPLTPGSPGPPERPVAAQVPRGHGGPPMDRPRWVVITLWAQVHVAPIAGQGATGHLAGHGPCQHTSGGLRPAPPPPAAPAARPSEESPVTAVVPWTGRTGRGACPGPSPGGGQDGDTRHALCAARQVQLSPRPAVRRQHPAAPRSGHAGRPLPELAASLGEDQPTPAACITIGGPARARGLEHGAHAWPAAWPAAEAAEHAAGGGRAAAPAAGPAVRDKQRGGQRLGAGGADGAGHQPATGQPGRPQACRQGGGLWGYGAFGGACSLPGKQRQWQQGSGPGSTRGGRGPAATAAAAALSAT